MMTRRVLAGALTLGLTVSCSATNESNIGTSTAALTSAPAPEMPTRLRATVVWQTPNPTGTLSASSPLYVVLTNHSSASMTLKLTVEASGLDQRSASFSFGNFTVGANSSVNFPFPASQLPVQSIGTESEAKLQIDDVTVGVPHPYHMVSTPIFYEFSSGYTSATMWGAHGKDYALGGIPPTDPHLLIQSVLASAAAEQTMTGRVWTGTGFTDVGRLPAIGSDAHLRQRGSYLVAGPRAQGFFDNEVNNPHVQMVGAYAYVICGQFQAEFNDAGLGEDRLDATESVNEFETAA